MKITQVTVATHSVYLNLMQCYEAEFSAITRKVPDESGVFSLDTHLNWLNSNVSPNASPSAATANNVTPNNGSGDDHNTAILAYLAWQGESPIGFMTMASSPGRQYEVCEFYIVPSVRNKNAGQELAATVWRLYPGTWVVKQIEGAEYASAFWRKCIARFLTGDSEPTEHTSVALGFEEDQFVDPYWGLVTRQTFSVP